MVGWLIVVLFIMYVLESCCTNKTRNPYRYVVPASSKMKPDGKGEATNQIK